MSKKRICFIAQFPPPMHGLSKAVETLYHSELNSEANPESKFEFEKVDITSNKSILKSLVAIMKSKADLFYFTISQSRGGNLRDLLILRLLKKKKVLIHLHGGYYRTLVDQDMPKWQRKMNYQVISNVAGAIVLGPSLKWIFEGMLPEENIYTVSNCVDNEFLMSENEFSEKIQTIHERPIKHVLYLSNFIKSKGYPEVLEMAKIEKEHVELGERKKFHFDFAGKFFENKEEEFFWNYVRENSLEDYVTYHGVVSGDKKRELLKLCDVFVLLTRYPNEGQPISILEAMGNGMAIIATNHAGIADVVDASVGCVLDKSSAGLPQNAMACLDLLDYPSLMKRGHQHVKTLYSEGMYVENMKNVFSNVMRK